MTDAVHAKHLVSVYMPWRSLTYMHANACTVYVSCMNYKKRSLSVHLLKAIPLPVDSITDNSCRFGEWVDWTMLSNGRTADRAGRRFGELFIIGWTRDVTAQSNDWWQLWYFTPSLPHFASPLFPISSTYIPASGARPLIYRRPHGCLCSACECSVVVTALVPPAWWCVRERCIMGRAAW